MTGRICEIYFELDKCRLMKVKIKIVILYVDAVLTVMKIDQN